MFGENHCFFSLSAGLSKESSLYLRSLPPPALALLCLHLDDLGADPPWALAEGSDVLPGPFTGPARLSAAVCRFAHVSSLFGLRSVFTFVVLFFGMHATQAA